MPQEIARVTVNLSLDRFFDYRIPEHLRGKIKTGTKVNVPFGNGVGNLRSVYVFEVLDSSPFPNLKEVDSICEGSPDIPDSLLKLAEWMALYYCCPREAAIRNLLPGSVRNGKIKPKTKLHYRIADHIACAEYIEKNTTKAKARVSVLKTLMLEHELPKDILLVRAGAGAGVLNTLVKAGLIAQEEHIEERDPFRNAQIIPTKPMEPTAEQAQALQIIFDTMDGKNGQHTVLVHGVTCSGKTEIYLQAIARALEQGGEAIVLVPEISLTPQTVGRFRARFGDMVSVLHSGLSEGERYDEWMKVHAGRVRIAVGARSALFAPFQKLRLIVVDEEHEQSYKQSEAPRYNARDVAVMRGKLEGATVILGSATPSLESHYNAVNGKYALAVLKKRSDPSMVMPDVRIIDMRAEPTENGKLPFLSKELVEAVRMRIAAGEQSILFLNRRGYARQMVCDSCGFVAMCPDCSVAYTYHKKSQILTCHLCGAMLKAYELCPQCRSDQIRYSGAGTERIENMAFAVFKGARIARMDSDSMTKPSLYEEILGKFRRGEIDILIGTQMIAKGLDYPNVTFVGVINADMGLFLQDFRAAERTFQLLTQVAGRAGRGETRGEVLIQTCNPYNSAIIAAADHDCDAFYSEELPIREELHLPPYGHMLTIHFSGSDPTRIEACAAQLMEHLKPCLDSETIVTDPAPAPVEKIKGKYRYIAAFRYGKLGALKQRLRYELCTLRPTKDVQIYADIDPLSMM